MSRGDSKKKNSESTDKVRVDKEEIENI